MNDGTDWSIWGGSDVAAVAATSLGVLAIGPDGTTNVIDSPPQSGTTTRCTVDDQLYALGSALRTTGTDGGNSSAGFDVSDWPATVPDTLHALSLTDPSSGWRALDAPPDVSDAAGRLACGPDGPLFIADGTEHYWSGEEWASAPVDPAFLDTLGTLRPASNAHTADRSYFVGDKAHTLLERTAPGRWQRLDQPATDVLGHGDSIYVIDANANTVTLLEPEA